MPVCEDRILLGYILAWFFGVHVTHIERWIADMIYMANTAMTTYLAL